MDVRGTLTSTAERLITMSMWSKRADFCQPEVIERPLTQPTQPHWEALKVLAGLNGEEARGSSKRS
jgi:hypothetical protein